MIVGSTTDGANANCEAVNAASSSTKAFGEIQVKNGGSLEVPGSTSGAHTLTVSDICLESGSQFIVGSPGSPITSSNKFTIVFTGNASTAGSSDQSCTGFKKGIDVASGATLELYGAKGVPQNGGVSWTTLVKPAGPQTAGVAATSSGPQTLYLTADVTKGTGPNGENEGWQPGDWIVVATSNFVPFDSEFVQIASVASGSNGVQGANSKITLTQPLQYYHFGSLAPSPATATCPDPLSQTGGTQPAFLCDGASQNYGVDERAEVGLISRNITLTAATATIVPPSSITNPDIAAATINEHWGGEIKIHNGFQVVGIQGVRLSKFGKAQLGSYPIHFHEVGAIGASQSVLINADSVDHSYNKCVTIHDTSNLTISNMVCARIVGHIFYEELGDATVNNVADDNDITFQDNLGLGAMSNSFDIYGVHVLANTGPVPAGTISRAQMIARYWWTGDNCAADQTCTGPNGYDGFNIPDTDNQAQATHGSCYTTTSDSGELTLDGSGNPPCAQGVIYSEPASGFWIQNPATNLIGNAIGGCQGVGNGFWWVPPQSVVTVNSASVQLMYAKLGTVKNNRAHACYNGFTDDGTPGGISSGHLFPHMSTNPNGYSASLIGTFDGVTATRNRFRGLWLRPVWFDVKNSHFATNRDNVTLLTSGGIDGNAPGVWELLRDSVLVGLSENNPGRWGPCAYNIPLSAPLPAIGGQFGCIDYVPSASPHSGDIFDNGYQNPKWNSAGYYLYDGPVRVFHDRFVNFNYNQGWTQDWKNGTQMPCNKPSAPSPGAFYRELDNADCTFLQYYENTYHNANNLPQPAPYEGDAAFGWFLANQNTYPTGTASKQLSFVNTNLRHQVFTAQVGIGGVFVDGDKNTSIIDEDGTLDGYSVKLAPNSGTNPVYPISLNNLPFNNTSNSVDECLSRGAQNERYEGRTSALMSPSSMGTLQFSSLYPNSGTFPGGVNSHWQQVTFTRDDLVSNGQGGTFHPTMVMRYGRNGLGSFEPKLSNGYGYTVAVAPTTAAGSPQSGMAGLAKWIDVTLADVVDPNISGAHPFYIRLGIDFASIQNGKAVIPANNFTIKRGFKSYTSSGVWAYSYSDPSSSPPTGSTDPELKKHWTPLDCFNLDALNTNNVPQSSNNYQGTCPAASGTSASGAVMTLSSATNIGALTANGQPVLDKYYYNPNTGYLYLNIVQNSPNPVAPSPTGSCDSAYDGGQPDSACPDTATGETYYACPKLGCTDYTIAINDPNYTPGPSPTTIKPAVPALTPAAPNQLVLDDGSNTVVTRQINLDDQNIPYYTATNAPNACTVTQPPLP